MPSDRLFQEILANFPWRTRVSVSYKSMIGFWQNPTPTIYYHPSNLSLFPDPSDQIENGAGGAGSGVFPRSWYTVELSLLLLLLLRVHISSPHVTCKLIYRVPLSHIRVNEFWSEAIFFHSRFCCAAFCLPKGANESLSRPNRKWRLSAGRSKKGRRWRRRIRQRDTYSRRLKFTNFYNLIFWYVQHYH